MFVQLSGYWRICAFFGAARPEQAAQHRPNALEIFEGQLLEGKTAIICYVADMNQFVREVTW